MATVANPKLSGVAPPTWRPYPGVSILYDNPGSAALSGVEPLTASSAAGRADQWLYDRLRVVAGEVESSMHHDGAVLCELPRHTYHVTVCDVVNEGTRRHVRRAMRSEVDGTLEELPDSLLWATSLLRLLCRSELPWSVWACPITFRVEGLRVWGQVLAAELVAADERSVAARASHEASRSELAARLGTRVGVQPREWRPHVSLGYFPNEHAAAHAAEHVVPEWQDRARERTEGLGLTFRSASVYGFTDMVSFWRLVG